MEEFSITSNNTLVTTNASVSNLASPLNEAEKGNYNINQATMDALDKEMQK